MTFGDLHQQVTMFQEIVLYLNASNTQPMDWFIYALQRFRDFDGRSRRKEFWNYILFYLLMSIGATFLDNIFGFSDVGDNVGPIHSLFVFIMLIPSIAVSVRRLHDVNKSGWFLLVGFIPIIGFIWLLIYYLRPGDYGPNRFGPDPKEEMA